jgi:hypothetical protein
MQSISAFCHWGWARSRFLGLRRHLEEAFEHFKPSSTAPYSDSFAWRCTLFYLGPWRCVHYQVPRQFSFDF